MDFTNTNTVIGSLNFALICIRFLAWPVIALGYPLLASIRAVERGSKYEMRKLVVYWTFFSLISLFEFAFDKIIQWMIPLWCSIRVVLVLWLVMGGFDGASHAYQTLVSPLLLSLNVDMKLNASEKLMPSKMECNDCEGDIQVVEAEEKESKTATVKERTPSESRPPQQEWRCDLCKVSTTSEKTLNHHLHGNKHKSNCESLRAAKTRPEWSCDLCKVSTTSEVMLNDHLQGINHKLKCESLRAAKTRPEWSCDLCKVSTISEKTLNHHLQGDKHKSNCESLKTSKQKCPETQQEEWRCDLCKVSTTSEKTLNHHLQGDKHKSNCESLKTSKQKCPETQQEWRCDLCKVSTTSEKTLNDHLQGNKHKSNCESLKTSKQRCPKTQQEWSCDLCKVRTTSEKTLNMHFQGSKHKSKCAGKDAGTPSTAMFVISS